MAGGFTEPTPIQRQAMTSLLAERELLAIAPTGSGARGGRGPDGPPSWRADRPVPSVAASVPAA